MTRVWGAVALGLALVLLGPAAATGGVRLEPEPPNWCFRMNDAGDLPSCTWDGTRWHRTYDSDMGLGGDTGVPGSFVAFGVLTLLVGLGTLAWRISLARRVARDAGLDPDRATELTLLADNGLEAAYLVGGLRPRPAEPVPPPSSATARSAEDRLRELQSLRDAGLVTAEEYDARRTAIVDSL